MKILILSDLHLEFADFNPTSTEFDVVVLAGDIGKNDAGIYWARSTWPDKPIIYVAGNHEFYGYSRKNVLSNLKSAAKDADVYFLDNEEIIINGVRFLGSTLWTDFCLFGTDKQNECMRNGQRGLNDFKVIVEGGLNFTPEDSLVLHQESIQWLESKLKHSSFDGETVVITHHCPSWNSVALRYQSDLLSACFASRLEHLMGYSKLWIHGHTHDSFDYDLNGTRVICNPRGYVLKNRKQENMSFNPDLIVDNA